MRHLLSLLFVIFCVGVAVAEDAPYDRIHSALMSRDFPTLNEEFRALSATARETGDYEALRNVFGRLFHQPDRKRFDHSMEWHRRD